MLCYFVVMESICFTQKYTQDPDFLLNLKRTQSITEHCLREQLLGTTFFPQRLTWNLPTNYVHTSTEAELRRLPILGNTQPFWMVPQIIQWHEL